MRDITIDTEQIPKSLVLTPEDFTPKELKYLFDIVDFLDRQQLPKLNPDLGRYLNNTPKKIDAVIKGCLHSILYCFLFAQLNTVEDI